jgi:hypothetical protein
MDQPNLDDLVFAIVQLFKNLNEPITDEGVKAELPSVDIKEIRASLQRLQDQGRIVGMPFTIYPTL